MKIMNFSLQMMKVPSPSFHHYRLMVRMIRKMVSLPPDGFLISNCFHICTYLPDHFVIWHSTSTCLSIRSRPISQIPVSVNIGYRDFARVFPFLIAHPIASIDSCLSLLFSTKLFTSHSIGLLSFNLPLR